MSSKSCQSDISVSEPSGTPLSNLPASLNESDPGITEMEEPKDNQSQQNGGAIENPINVSCRCKIPPSGDVTPGSIDDVVIEMKKLRDVYKEGFAEKDVLSRKQRKLWNQDLRAIVRSEMMLIMREKSSISSITDVTQVIGQTRATSHDPRRDYPPSGAINMTSGANLDSDYEKPDFSKIVAALSTKDQIGAIVGICLASFTIIVAIVVWLVPSSGSPDSLALVAAFFALLTSIKATWNSAYLAAANGMVKKHPGFRTY